MPPNISMATFFLKFWICFICNYFIIGSRVQNVKPFKNSQPQNLLEGSDLTFDLAVVTLTYKILSELYLGNGKVYEVEVWLWTLVRGCRCATSWCDLDLTFDLVVVTLTYKMLSGLYLENHKV